MRFLPALVFVVIAFQFLSCRKVNEATLLGGGLVPEVDNITTFETFANTKDSNGLLADTSKLVYGDPVVLGNIANDPAFGQTNASLFFQLNASAYKKYPFVSKQNFTVDSVVLSLGYIESWGDSTMPQTVHVYEVSNTASLNDTTYYTSSQPDFTTGSELGSATFTFKSLNDSISIIRTDTTRVSHRLRIHLDPSLGDRLASYDTLPGSNGGYYNDTLFKTLFRGLAVKADNGSGNALGYFNLATTATNLTVYYKATVNGVVDTAETVFYHGQRLANSAGGQANPVRRTPGGGWAAALGNTSEDADQLFIQSTPGSAAFFTIPPLDTFQNKLIHSAELIASVLPSDGSTFFTAPPFLFVDRLNAAKDSAFLQPQFLVLSQTGTAYTYNFSTAGGGLLSNNTYRLNVTNLVQDIISKKIANPVMRLYAPYDSRPFNPLVTGQRILVQSTPYMGYGRVVLGGSSYADTTQQLRLRIVYSNL